MKSISRRKFLTTASAGTLAVTVTFARPGRAQSTITMRVSSSMSADQNAAHFIWYERFAANLKSGLGDRVTLGYFPDSQLGKEADIVQQVKVGSVDMSVIPAAAASSTAYWISGLSTTGSISLGCALVAGRKRVPKPATGNTALRMRVEEVDMGSSASF